MLLEQEMVIGGSDICTDEMLFINREILKASS